MAPDLAEVEVLPVQPRLHGSTSTAVHVSDTKEDDLTKSEETSLYDGRNPLALAPREEPASAGDSLLRFFRLRKQRERIDPDAIATQESVFDGPHAAEYQPIPEWENIRLFDPKFRWTHREEARVRRKCDFWVFAWVVVMFFALDIDRFNIGAATADNLLKDLKLTQGDYNLGNTLSKLGFLIAELPSQMIGKKIGVDLWLPMQLVVFAVLSVGQFAMKNRATFLALRFLIAFFQGGFIPDVILYLSYWYPNHELPIRIAIFFTTKMFLIEGLLTLVIGIASFFMLAPSPSQTKARWRPNGFLTEREAQIAVMRVIRDEPQKATMHNRQALTPGLLWRSAKDFDLWPMYLVGLTYGLPGVPVSAYFQLSMRGLGFSTVMSNLLSVPYTVLGIIMLLVIVALSELINVRTWVAVLQNVWYLPIFIALRTLPDPIAPWSYWVLASLALAAPYAHGLQVSWASRNSGSVRTRTFSAAAYNISNQLSNIIGSNLYQASDAPRYFRGNTIILAIVCFNVFIAYPAVYLYYGARNAYKEKRWSAMTVEEQKHYLATTEDEGTRRLDFRFIR
ncbi:hypothetical protein Rhopal_002894-T1 [Rhodotorula paludigena]|uniref:Allantoate permease n=1 Tax=Rhodotorula paludigena TaxID=86838 RepID=A0AAV5GJ83_9BASI|nr:hypothetical protein Rhopal_002894-T1 [Rhodotorula paludigena]